MGFLHSEKGTFYYRKNVLGDITEIIDSFGTVKGKYSYTAFGECTILEDVNGIATANPFRYRGYYYDSTTNFYYLKSRYYDPVVCRFITFDDLQYLDPEHIGGLNLYAYCNNNPIMYVDPDGTKIIDIKKVYKAGKKIWKKIKKGVDKQRNVWYYKLRCRKRENKTDKRAADTEPWKLDNQTTLKIHEKIRMKFQGTTKRIVRFELTTSHDSERIKKAKRNYASAGRPAKDKFGSGQNHNMRV